jgi:hypothetical protein
MDNKDILELISLDTVVALLLMFQLEDALVWLEVVLVITAIVYNIVRILHVRNKSNNDKNSL